MRTGIAGNALPEGGRPIAQAYAGHQFGHFTALGDGRAILIGEQITPSGDRLDISFVSFGDGKLTNQYGVKLYNVGQPLVSLRRQGSGLRETFTVRKVSFGVGVERTFPVHTPVIEKIEVVTRGDVRRAKLYYLRDLRGKAAKIKEKRDTPTNR